MTIGEVEVPYLILHKVRGEPAFDVAIKVMIGDEEGWIIPTSGHRAYPYQHWLLDTYSDLMPMPNDCPDHYGVKAAPKVGLRDLLAKIVRPIASNFKKRAI